MNADPRYFKILINDDENRVIRWRKTDKEILCRMDELFQYALSETEKLGLISHSNPYFVPLYNKMGERMNNMFDYTFGEGSAAAMFDGSNPLGIAAETGNRLIWDALSQVMPIVRSCMEGI